MNNFEKQMNNMVLNYDVEKSILIIVVFLLVLFIIIKKIKKNYNKLDDKEKELYNKAKNKIKISMIICIVICLILTTIFSIRYFYNSKKFTEDMLKTGELVETLNPPKILVVERYLVLNIFICYLIYRFLLNVNSKLSQEEKNILKKVYSLVTLFMIILTIINEVLYIILSMP